jgi:hypothetical protein
MIKSKRFWIVTAGTLIWIVGVFHFHQNPVSFATGLALMEAPYLAAETFRPSENKLQ